MRKPLVKLSRLTTVTVLLSLVLGGLASANGATASPRTYKNCVELNRAFKFGVALKSNSKNLGAQAIFTPVVNASVYNRNKRLDADRDGIACEVVRKSALPQPSSPASIDTAMSLAKPLDTCRLRETSNPSGAGAKGFPARQTVSSTGEIKVVILPVDFSNAVGAGDPESLYRDDVAKIEEWGKYFSRGKLSYKVELKARSWLRAPKGADWYTCVECQKGAKEQKQSQQDAMQQLIDVADALYDFRSTDFLYFVFPYEAERKYGTALYAHRVTLQTKEGPITVSAYGEMGGGVGAIADRGKIWDHAIHEFLHFQGFIGHGPDNSSDYYISTNQWGVSKAVTSWEAFLNGWFAESEVLCLDKKDIKQQVTVTLDSIDNFGGKVESVMIRIDADQLLVVELRADGPFTNLSARTPPGFTAYRVNVNGEHYRNDADPNSASKNFWAYVKEGSSYVIKSSVEFAGIKITRLGENQIGISNVGY